MAQGGLSHKLARTQSHERPHRIQSQGGNTTAFNEQSKDCDPLRNDNVNGDTTIPSLINHYSIASNSVHSNFAVSPFPIKQFHGTQELTECRKPAKEITFASPEVSVVIPTKNEEASVGACIQRVLDTFQKFGINGEIIVADNSTDKTPIIARTLGAIVVTPDSLGYGNAYRFGFSQAKGRYLVMGDADNTYDFGDIPRLIEPLRNGTADMVMGSRLNGEIKKGSMPALHQYIGNPLLTWFLNFFFSAGVSDSHSGFRAFTREALNKMNLKSSGMEFASEMIINAARKGIRISEVPIVYHPRIGESKLSSFDDGWRHLKFMLLYTPKHLFIIPGFILLIFGIFLMSSAVFDYNIVYPPGIHTMIFGSLFIVSGYQIVSLGVFAARYGKKKDIIDVDPITGWIIKNSSIERGIIVGLIFFFFGFSYLMYRVIGWTINGFPTFPWVEQNLIAFTLVIVGLQTGFYSFFMCLIDGGGK